MAELNMETRPSRVREIAFQSMPPDTILLNLDNGYYYSTNRIGAAVWERCDGTKPLKAILAEIGRACGVPGEDIREDILGFVRDMIKEGLVKAETD